MSEIFDNSPKHKITILKKEIRKTKKYVHYRFLAQADKDPRKFECNYTFTREIVKEMLFDPTELMFHILSDSYDNLLSQEGKKGWIDD